MIDKLRITILAEDKRHQSFVQELTRRQRQLAAELDVARKDGERIAHFIPKRNIETWILCLDGEIVNEIENYRKDRSIEERIGRAAQIFFDRTRPNAAVPNHCVLSLRAAIPEARRLEQ